MIKHDAYTVEPWCVRETFLDLDRLAQSESLFALSNGHIGVRGNLDEGEPHGLPGTYLNSLYELRPLPYAEAGYGFPESGQTVINVTNGKLIRLLVDDEPFDVRYGELHDHERCLDFHSGTLIRTADWTSPAGQRIQVRTERIVSLTHRSVVAIRYEVTPIDDPAQFVVQSGLIANEDLPQLGKDPRTAAVLRSPLVPNDHGSEGTMAFLLHTTRQSRLRMGAIMEHEIDCPGKIDINSSAYENDARITMTTRLEPGQTLRFVKFIAYGWSSLRTMPAIHDQVMAAIAAAKHMGWDGLAEAQRSYLDDFWYRADVEVDGDLELQQAVRFAMFHVLQAGARGERRPIPAKGLTGPGYDGHAFWDTETYALQVLTYTAPDTVGDALYWRYITLDKARARARQLGLEGAAFPWRSLNGDECSAYWPAGTAAFHVNADIADAVLRYLDATGDEKFGREAGLELLVETARLWRSLGQRDLRGRFRIDGITGPDEYSAIADNNVYTNLMAARNLTGAADAAQRHPKHAAALGVSAEEMASWRDAARNVLIPYNETLGVHEQAEGFTSHERWPFEETKPDQYPLMLNFPYFDIYRKQVIKQVDLVLAMYLVGDAFSDVEKRRNFDYYEELTVRDSSLSACIQAIVAAEVGHLDLAFDYAGEAALMDLDDLEQNTRDGLHIASLAGSWLALVAGFGGLRTAPGTLRFRPRLPQGLVTLRFRMSWHGTVLRVCVTHQTVTYEVLGDGEVKLFHENEPITVAAGKPVTLPMPEPPPEERAPIAPAGRAPRRRGNTRAEPLKARPSIRFHTGR